MKKLLFAVISISILQFAHAQIVTLTPSKVVSADSVKVVFDSSKGTGGLSDATSIYMHSGVITSGTTGTDWQYVIGNWGKDDGIGKMKRVAGSNTLWEITLKPSIKEYYKVPSGVNIFRLSMVFRNTDGTKEGKGSTGAFQGGTVASNGDIFMDLDVQNFVSIKSPESNQFVLRGGSFPINTEASSIADTIKVEINAGNGYQTLGTTTNSKTFNLNYSPAIGDSLKIRATAVFGNIKVTNTRAIYIYLRSATTSATPPAELKDGINYIESDPTKAILSLLAPNKEFVYVVGDFNNWQLSDDYSMKRSSQNPERFFLEMSNLENKKEYVFQYWVDGTIKVGDPFADKVADPWNDEYIPASVYPNLPNYKMQQNGVATVLQTGQQLYPWSSTETNWKRPNKEDLVIYELLVRDFVRTHDYKTVMDSLPYLKKLGINAIELMPIMEFEGNSSWGYNPAYFFAPDKYYGTKNDLKAFIEKCHQEGMAVILDMVLNHSFGQNPMVRMYFENDAPSTTSPWFNVAATHPFNVGYDFNHESQYTKDFVDKVNKYWLEEYHFDGYRFDLSKGFTQKNNPDNVGAWGAFDQSRIDILKRMANAIWSTDPSAYVILEHFADQSEEKVLKDAGMLVWGNSNHDFRQLLSGNSTPSTSAVAQSGRVSYMESHDEQRLMFEMKNSGQSQGAYDTRNISVGLNRVKLASAFFYTLPGPKMLWQFQELGYDIDIDQNGRTGEKPLPWGSGGLGFYEDAERQKLYKSTAAIINFVKQQKQNLQASAVSSNLGGIVRTISFDSDSIKARVVGNFGLKKENTTISFPKSGNWYNFFDRDTLVVSNTSMTMDLAPGQFVIYLDKPIFAPEADLVTVFKPIVTPNPEGFTANDEVTFTLDATATYPRGINGLTGSTKIWTYAGVVLSPNSNEVTNLKGTQDASSTQGELTKVAETSNQWQIKMKPREYFGVLAGQRIYKIAFKFRNENEKKGTDANDQFIFLDVQPEDALQIVKVSPEKFSSSDLITIIFDAEASFPAGALVGENNIYMHSGVVTSGPTGTTWTNVIGNWGVDDGIGKMTKVAGTANKWQITITPRAYYKVPNNLKIYKLGMVFRSANGSKEGKGEGLKDIFIVVPISDDITGIEDLKTDFNYYPNPVTQSLKINLAATTTLFDINFFGISGQKLGEIPMIKGIDGQFELDMSDFSAGTYYLIFSDGKQKYGAKIIKL